MERICLFCGSSPGARPEYAEAARALGRVTAEEGLTLVYGGSSVGLLAEAADAALAAGGQVVGVIPRALYEKEIAHKGLTELHVVDSMHQRKALMAELSDGFVALPGGLGTLEEFFEVLTWAQLGFHAKPCGLLDVCRFFDQLRDFLDRCVAERFIRQQHRDIVLISENPAELIAEFRVYTAPYVAKWIERGDL